MSTKKRGPLAEPQRNVSRLSHCYVIADPSFHTKQVWYDINSHKIALMQVNS